MENIPPLHPFAEVVQSSLYEWRVHCWEWDIFPSLGSLVTIETEQRVSFGLVCQVETGSLDALRIPYPYKKTESELKREHPHIFEFLKTTFACLPLGYQEKLGPISQNTSSGQALFYQIPPEPPKIHAFVTYTSKASTEQFFSDPRYLHVLFGLSSLTYNLDELLLAMLKKQAEIGLLTEEHLLNFTQTFSLLTGNDYRRLKLFLQRASQLLPSKPAYENVF